MITFIIVSIALLMLAISAVTVILAGGAGLIVAFGDLIVFGLIMWVIIRIIRRRR